MKIWIVFLSLFLFIGCSQKEQMPPPFKILEIAGRDHAPNSSKPLIYRVKVPNDWIVQIPSAQNSLSDTTKALAEFFIIDGNQSIRIAIHNFPSDKMTQRIPPIAQLNRWKKQFQSVDPVSFRILPQAFAGYSGFRIEAKGLLGNVKSALLGWALQLSSEHYQALSHSNSPLLALKYRQMRADVTIKATGEESLMDQHKQDIIAFARSFQLIDDIP
ncbi:MAG: hypothetical protein HWD61_00800 [Parachlamydiaceae bacterium]|nr:MAG: hypothetical protein HWD61_00800 [Parachlamydiaceae bacterium]